MSIVVTAHTLIRAKETFFFYSWQQVVAKTAGVILAQRFSELDFVLLLKL